jgi:S-adenosylmethionine:tRNA ribosyltransferase-isomerase
MRTDDLDFQLPAELIAQTPAPDRAQSRLLHYRRSDRSITHRQFSDLPNLLASGDLLIFNDAKVLPARFMLRKITGGRVEGLFLAQVRPGVWNVLLKNLGKARQLYFDADPSLACNVVLVKGEGQYELSVASDEPALNVLSRYGRMPLPPYIRRGKQHDDRDDEDRRRYQTVYARNAGSVAAPTAGLHFTEALLASLNALGVQRAAVTLDVSLGTFKTVTVPTLAEHKMHVETYAIPAKTAKTLNLAKSQNRRIIAVGTTSARVLESQPSDVPFQAKRDETGILIRPPYTWKHVGALLTNFHLPRSTLIALVAALVGLEEQRRIYQIAIEQRYRFFSYGDAMFIE